MTKAPTVTAKVTKEPEISGKPTVEVTKEPEISREPTGEVTVTPGTEVTKAPTITQAPETPSVTITESAKEPTSEPGVTEEPQKPTEEPALTKEPQKPTNEPSVTKAPEPTDNPIPTATPVPTLPIVGEVRDLGENDIYSDITGPRRDDADTTIYDCIYFGNYPQSDNTGETMEPIKWRVLSVKGTDAFVMSDSILDYVSNSNDVWENSQLRSWLNGYGSSSNSQGYDYTEDNFIDRAFTKEEQDAIMTSDIQIEVNNSSSSSMNQKEWSVSQDKVYLLSSEDLVDTFYGFTYSLDINDKCRECYYSPYASPYNVVVCEKRGNCFLLDWKGGNKYGVCPVLHLDLSKEELWTAAGQVRVEKNENTSDMSNITIMHPGDTKEFSTEGKSILTYKVYEYSTGYTYGLGNSSDIHPFSEAESFTVEKTGKDTITVGIPEAYTGSGLKKQLCITIIDQDEKEYTYDLVIWMLADGFAYNVCDGEAVVLEYVGEDKNKIKELSIPSTLGEVPVSKVASGFLECNELVRIKAAEGIREINVKNPYLTYYDKNTEDRKNKKYQKMTVPATIQNISAYVKEIEFADGTTEVPANVCQDVAGLVKVGIPESVTAIRDNAFKNQTSLTMTELPEQVTSYGAYSFYQCNVILDKFPEGIKNVGDCAFEGCQMTASKLPENIENIGKRAFYDCALTINELPSNLVTIGKDAFYGSTLADTLTVPPSLKECIALNGIKKIVLAEGRTSIDGTLLAGVTSIEELILPRTLTTITGSNVFKDCKNVKELFLPNTIESITASWNSGALRECPIRKIIFEDGWESIPAYMFYYSEALEEVVLPDSITRIEGYTFAWTGLKSLKLPANMSYLGDSAFGFCRQLEKVTVPATDNIETTINGVFGAAHIKTVEFEDGITKIPSYFFDNAGVEELILPDSITRIGNFAFKSAEIKTLRLPANISYLGTYSFAFCSNLEKIIFPAGLDTLEASGWGAFSGTEFKTVEFETGVTKVPDDILTNSDVEEVILPDTVKEIGARSFWGCKSLKSISLPEGLETLGQYCFRDCEGLEEITIPSTLKQVGGALGPSFENSGLKKVTFAEGITGIPSSIFTGASKLTEVVLPESMKVISAYAFTKCSSLETIHLPESLLSIGTSAFEGCTSLKEITIPKGVTSIGDGLMGPAFENTGIETVYFEEGTTVIPADAFNNCKTLKYVVLPSTVEEIGGRAFFYCENLESITIPNGVKKLGEYAFGYTTSLKTIVLPKSLVKYGDPLVGPSFEGSGLETAVLEEGTTKVFEGSFMNCEHLTSIQIPDTVTGIENRAFWGCKAMTEFTISPYITSLGEAVFYDSGISKISIPATVKSCGSMAYSAFDGENIKEVTLEEGFEEIYPGMFAVCNGLTKVNCPSTLRKIGDNAFNSCGALPSFEVPDGVTSIGVFAFADCNSMTSIVIPASVTSIDDSAFNKIADQNAPYPTIITTQGSTAHTFAVGKNIPFTCN